MANRLAAWLSKARNALTDRPRSSAEKCGRSQLTFARQLSQCGRDSHSPPVRGYQKEAERMKLTTRITGYINGSSFECSGEGEMSDEGDSTSQLRFNTPLVRFTPKYGKSWQCGNHKKKKILTLGDAPFVVDNPLSLFLDEGGNILERTVIQFPYPNSIILATSITHRPDAEDQHLYQTRVGTFDGPTDIVEERPFTEHIIPAGTGRALGHSVRHVVRSNGEVIEIVYRDELLFSDNFTLPFGMAINISGEDEYDADARIYTVNAHVDVTRTG